MISFQVPQQRKIKNIDIVSSIIALITKMF